MAKKITKFTRENLDILRPIIEDTLNKELTKFGLSIDLGSISFGDNDFRTKLKVMCGTNEDGAKRDWEKYARLFGLNAEDFGTLFINGGKTFQVSGIAVKSRKYPILATNEHGVEYKFPAHVLKAKDNA